MFQTYHNTALTGMPLLMHFAKPDKEDLSSLPLISDEMLKYNMSIGYNYNKQILPESIVEYYCGKMSVTHKKTASTKPDKSNDTVNTDK